MSLRLNAPHPSWWRTEFAALAVLSALCWIPLSPFSVPAAGLLILYWPGRCMVRLLPEIAAAPGRFWSGVGASMLFVPLWLTVIWSFTNQRAAVWAAVLFMDAALSFLTAGRILPRTVTAFADARSRRLLGLLIAYVATLVFCFYWLPTAWGRVAASPSGDYIKHHAVLWSLSEFPLPLHNLFFATESGAGYYYYHYHYLLPVAIRRLSGDGISLATGFGLTSAIVSALFIAFVFLIARHLLKSEKAALLAAVCSTLVGGWDIIPVLFRWLNGHRMVVVLDSWSPFAWRIHNVLDNFIWCPQHVSAVVGLLMCAYWLQQAPGKRWWYAVTPLAAASVFGTSVYQAMTMLAAAGLLACFRYWPARSRHLPSLRTLLFIIGAVVFAAVLSLPQASHYRLMGHRYPGGLTWHWERFQYAFVGRFAQPGVLANLLDAPWLILLEFGLPALAMLLITKKSWSEAWSDRGVELLGLAGVIGLATMFIIRSDTTRIDYAFRAAVMPANVFAAMLAAMMIRSEAVRPFIRPWRRRILVAGCLLGVPVGIYELPAMATRTLLQEKFLYDDPTVLRFLRDRLPAGSVVQSDPRGFTLPQVIERPVGVLDPENPHVLVLRPPVPGRMYEACEQVEQAFATTQPSEARTLLRKWGVTHVLAGRTEHRLWGALPQFDSPLFKPVFTNEGSVVYEIEKTDAALTARPSNH